MRGALWRVVAWTLVISSIGPAAFGLGKGKAVYMGGTVAAIKDQTEGQIDLKNQERLIFRAKAGSIEIPWASISEMEYGQKAGRRVVMAVVLTPWALFSKNRKHYVTFSWTDAEGKEQAAVLQFDKNDIRPALAIMKARTGDRLPGRRSAEADGRRVDGKEVTVVSVASRRTSRIWTPPSREK